MKNLIWALAILFVTVVPASAQVEVKGENPFPAIAQSRHMFACIEFVVEPGSADERPAIVQTCAKIEKFASWSVQGIANLQDIKIDMDHPARPDWGIIALRYDRAVSQWKVVMRHKDHYIRAIPILKFIIY